MRTNRLNLAGYANPYAAIRSRSFVNISQTCRSLLKFSTVFREYQIAWHALSTCCGLAPTALPNALRRQTTTPSGLFQLAPIAAITIQNLITMVCIFGFKMMQFRRPCSLCATTVRHVIFVQRFTSFSGVAITAASPKRTFGKSCGADTPAKLSVPRGITTCRMNPVCSMNTCDRSP